MKKSLFAGFWIALAMIATSEVQGQASFSFGPKVGYTSSHLTIDQDTIESDFRQGFQGGLFFRFSTRAFYVQPEVVYVTKGGIFQNPQNTFREEVLISSVDIPVIFGLKLGEDELNFRLHGGPVASFVIDKEIELSGNAVTGLLNKHDLKDSSLGIQFGVGFDVMPFSLDVRYEMGWDKIYEPKAGDVDYNVRQNMFNLSLALKLL